jgi:hypothetical protein
MCGVVLPLLLGPSPSLRLGAMQDMGECVDNATIISSSMACFHAQGLAVAAQAPAAVGC